MNNLLQGLIYNYNIKFDILARVEINNLSRQKLHPAPTLWRLNCDPLKTETPEN